jgi:CheY-like chemotaxis protein
METILILDDDPANLQVIGDVLRSERYHVLEASTGLQGFETGKKCGAMSLFVTDIELPDASGIDIALKLAQPSQFDRSDAGMRFVFNKGTPKVSTTF